MKRGSWILHTIHEGLIRGIFIIGTGGDHRIPPGKDSQQPIRGSELRYSKGNVVDAI